MGVFLRRLNTFQSRVCRDTFQKTVKRLQKRLADSTDRKIYKTGFQCGRRISIKTISVILEKSKRTTDFTAEAFVYGMVVTSILDSLRMVGMALATTSS